MLEFKKTEGIQLLPNHDEAPPDMSPRNIETNSQTQNKKLNVFQGAALLTADCLGTGLLALPHDIKVLSFGVGVGFLVANLPINLYAGTILSNAASHVETMHNKEIRTKTTNYNSIQKNDDDCKISGEDNEVDTDIATFDFVGMTSALFHEKKATFLVMILFYCNIFLVLGNYILVMSRAVSAMFLDQICLTSAGAMASVLMFAVCQLRTMERLGRTASIISLLALFVVVLQCLYFANTVDLNEDQNIAKEEEESTIFNKLSACGSIGFAVGSQKLFLNIRHELADRDSAPRSLAISLSCFGLFYVLIILCAGENPPGFLFDAIPPAGLNRRLAGFFLWIHVVVSYAINSQAICASIDRIFLQKWESVGSMPEKNRWMLLSGSMALSAFVVANAIPFFKDLVAFIGALTSVPLTLLLPAVFHRKIMNIPIWFSPKDLTSFALVVFSVIFAVTALLGSIDSIFNDWRHHTGGFFSCR